MVCWQGVHKKGVLRASIHDAPIHSPGIWHRPAAPKLASCACRSRHGWGSRPACEHARASRGKPVTPLLRWCVSRTAAATAQPLTHRGHVLQRPVQALILSRHFAAGLAVRQPPPPPPLCAACPNRRRRHYCRSRPAEE